jgi:hypothetical protein
MARQTGLELGDAAEKVDGTFQFISGFQLALFVFKLFYEYDLAGCEREFRRALTLNPNYAFAHDQFGMALSFRGGSTKRSPRASAQSNWTRCFPRS